MKSKTQNDLDSANATIQALQGALDERDSTIKQMTQAIKQRDEKIELMAARTERDFEILRRDVDGYKSEVARKDRMILELQAQIGRICIQKGIVQ